MKLQSAMEYLMTYGWAILIIALVMVVMFGLNLFNVNTYAPKASPGSCSVYQSISGAALTGTCNNEIPQYVASISNQQQSSPGQPPVYISMPIPSSAHFTNQFTASAWVSPLGGNMKEPVFSMDCGQIFEMNYDGTTQDTFDFYAVSTGVNSRPGVFATLGHWYDLVGTYNSGTLSFYVNGQYVNGTTATGSLTPQGGLNVSNEGGCAEALIGDVSNVQLYNASLPASDIKSLYLEGVGGAPIDLNYLVGWWPLNGNANDYSGFGNNGQPSNVIYISNWYSNYAQP